MSISPKFNRAVLTVALLATASLGGGCSALDRFASLGEKPALTAIENPTAQPGYKPVQMPMPKPEPASYNANSLWRNGSPALFKDHRASHIRGLLTLTVNFTDKANTANETQRSGASKKDSGIPSFLGDKLIKNPATAFLPGRLFTADGTSSTD